MVKLYSPYLEGTIPAFYGDSITVPFAMNRAVGKNEVKGFSLLVKSIQTGQQIVVLTTFINFDLDKGFVTYNMPKGNADKYFKIGQSYKFQLAYIDQSGNTGYYSTVTIAKRTVQPTIEIQGLKKSTLNNHQYSYIGKYTTQDPTEKMYSCQFKVYDQTNNIIKDTGEIIHNSLNDAPSDKEGVYTMLETFDLIQELESGKNYYIQFLVKTIGLMELDSGKYQIVQKEPIPPSTRFSTKAYLNYDNGYIDIELESNNSNKNLNGKYVLSRASDKDNFTSWNEIMRFTVTNTTQKEIWKDFTIEYGVRYQYAIFMVDEKNNYSTKATSDIVLADFEDMFLFDGDRQLKIRFNPKVSNFKNVRQEQKTDTIGGKYPYIFRNGHVDYKEFAISGLISHLTDADGYFENALAQTKYNDSNTLTIGGTYANQLNSENFAMEKDFKLMVLDWLTNGKSKLFRSPAEGNYIVRLMNISLTPTDSLSRMLHTFNCTAYEIKEYTHKNLIDSQIIKDNLLIGVNSIISPKITIINLSDITDNNYLQEHNLQDIKGATFSGISKSTPVKINEKDVDVYLSNDFRNIPIKSLKKSSKIDKYTEGTVTLYRDEEVVPSINSSIGGVSTLEIPIIQFYGKKDTQINATTKKNLLQSFLVKHGKEYLSQLFSIKCTRRSVYEAYTDDLDWTVLTDRSGNLIVENNKYLYRVLDKNTGAFLGYKDQGEKLSGDSWKNLTQQGVLTLQDSKQYRYEYIDYNKDYYKDINTLDFNSLIGIYADIFLIVELCCRVGSYDLNDSGDTDLSTYEQAIKDFQEGNYDSQSKLEGILNIIKKFQGGN